MKAIWIEADGTETEVTPNSGFTKESENSFGFTLEELQGFVRDGDRNMVEHIGFPDETEMYINEEGKLHDLEINSKATGIWRKHHGATDVIVGNVLFINPE